MRKKPPYALSSVDNALVLATVLRTEGSLTVTDAARRLGVAQSTAHRLLAMLVYRDFAVQDASRTYRPGPAFALGQHRGLGTGLLREIALPHVEAMSRRTGETVNLLVRVGDRVHFIASWESTRPLRVGVREGMTFPAHLTSGGLVLLTQLPGRELAELYSEERWSGRESERPDPGELHRELEVVRRSGFAVQRNRGEPGVTGIGVGLGPTGLTPAALTVGMPTLRYDPADLEHWVRDLRAVAAEITEAARTSTGEQEE